MPAKKKAAAPKKEIKCHKYTRKPCSAWVRHVQRVWKEMGGGKGLKGENYPTYKEAMCKARACWDKEEHKRKLPKKDNPCDGECSNVNE